MQASRNALRASRTAQQCIRRQTRQPRRFESTSSTSSSAGSSPALVGAISGAASAALLGYGYYWYSGAKTVVDTAKQAQSYANSAQQKFKQQVQDKAPNPNEALRWLRQVASHYAGFIPGAQGIVNTTFDDFDKIHAKHADEVDQIASDAYNELKGVATKGDMSLATAQQTWTILQKHFQRIAELAGDAAEDILENHPRLKSAVGDNLQQLKQMGDQYGPQAKEQVQQTWNEIRDVAKNGLSPDTISKIQQIVQEKVEQVRKLGDQAWQKGLEQAKPMLDKNPKVKQLVEENADALKNGNVAQLWETVKDAASSGSTEKLEKYVNQAKDKAQGVAGNWDQYLKMVPGGGDLGQKIQQLQAIAQAKGPEAKKLMEATAKDIEGVLAKRSDEAKKLAEEAKKQS